MPLTNEHGTQLIIKIFMSDTVSAKCCHKQVCSPSSTKLGHPAYEKHAHAISLSSVTGVSSFRTEELIEMNQNCFFLSLKESTCQEQSRNFPSLAIAVYS